MKMLSTEEALAKIKEVHGEKYKIPDGWQYVNAKAPIEMKCPIHGKFVKDFYRLVNLKQGCPMCSHGVKAIRMFGYWNNKEHCIEEARKYTSKWDLQRHCIGCYNGLVRNGWLEEVSKMVFDGSIHYKDYSELIHCIYVYEYSGQKTCYVGRTSQLKRRHRQHKNGYGHKDGSRTYDVVYQFAAENEIEIPQPKILEEGLNAEESQRQEDYWRQKYIQDGWNCLNKAATGVGKGSLGASLKWTYETCKEEAKKYDCRYHMRLRCPAAYWPSVRNCWITEFFPQKRKKDDKWWEDLEHVKEAAAQCSGARDMVKKFGGAYNVARRNGWLKELKYKTE